MILSRQATRLAVCAALLGPWLSAAASAAPQAGDDPKEHQPPLPPEFALPPAPVLSPEEALQTFVLPRGFSIELVAAEPLVRDPVAFSFAPDGRLWIAEMCGYMNDLAGSGEGEPSGAIVVLADEDGDGRMDARTVFADGLVLPRALALTRGGVLVIAPPELLFLEDTDDDGIADRRTVLERGHAGLASPEHAINGLLPTLDNAFACANVPWRYVYKENKFQREATSGGGQWGISQDDRGRLFYDYNSDPLRYDALPSRYLARNPDAGAPRGTNLQVVQDLSVRPSRTTPGVNRGYRPGFLVEGKLKEATAVCSPWIFRGGTFESPYAGAAFVCEPAANLVLAYALDDDAGALAGHALRHGGADGEELDFLTSTDERFRPVALCDGPDGALYIADMYRGLIQHRLFVTTFLKQQVEARGLEQPIAHGRIWRVRRTAAPRPEPLALGDAAWADLAAALSSDNGWVRDRVQQIFVEEGAEELKAKTALRNLLAGDAPPLARVHALWALAGMRALQPELVLAALSHADPRVREAALRAGEPFASDARILARWLELARDPKSGLRTQVLLSLGELHTPRAEQALADLLLENAPSPIERFAALTSLARREVPFLSDLLERRDFDADRPGRAPLVRELAACVARSSSDVGMGLVLDQIVDARRLTWQREALIAGLLDGRSPASPGRPAGLRFVEEPRALRTLTRLVEQIGRDNAPSLTQLLDSISWPGHPLEGETPIRPLDAGERESFERGRTLFANVCSGCHQPTGLGMAGMAPPLRGSEWVHGRPEILARILVGGLTGPIRVKGDLWELDMPAVVATDEEIAGVLTYIRREWGHGADPVPLSVVTAARAACKSRTAPFTAAELEALAKQ
jgi:mono/diheme cytochrome c family protein/glucose/arabinose dehydrogenase